MRCKKCNGTGEITVPVEEHMGTVLYGTEQCDECDGTGEVLTNEEYLRSCTTEQLAERLASTFDLCGAGCHHCFLANVCLTKAKNGNCLTQEQMIVEWLKQPHTKGDSE